MHNDLAVKWIKMAAIYLALGVSLGLLIGKTHDFTLVTVHAHLNLVGWATMALMGVLHHVFAKQLLNKLATAQFWMHQLATPVMLLSLAGFKLGKTALEPVLGISSMVVGVSVLVFTYNVLRNLGSGEPA